MNVQTERIDNHRAQFTVEIEPKQLDDAKRQAAKHLARQVRIKGFRKGKAPYRIIAQYVGEAAILEEAVELLGNDVYKHALDESEVEPYGPGSLDDFKVEPNPTFVFSVPLQPEVDLKAYADIRLDFEDPEVTDDDVERALQQMRQQEAEVSEEEFEVVEVGHRITADIHSEFVDGEEPEDDDEADESDDVDADDDDTPYIPKKGDNFLHRHDAKFMLDPENEPVLPGFIDALAGAELGEEKEFELTIPEDDEDYKDIFGRKVKFFVTIKDIEKVTLPELNDEFALKITEAEGEEPLDLEGLRKRTREELEKDALENAKSQFGDKVLTKIVEQAEIAYPELMIEERIDDMIRDLDGQLRQQGMNLENYMRITGTTKESLQEQYRDSAIESLERTLVLRELVTAQGIEMGDEQIEKRLDNMMIQFGAQGNQFRSLIDTPQMRENILNELLMDNVMTRLVAIGRGQDPLEAIQQREAEVEADAEKARARVEKMMAAQETAPVEDDEADVEDVEIVSEANAEETSELESSAEMDEDSSTEDQTDDSVEETDQPESEEED